MLHTAIASPAPAETPATTTALEVRHLTTDFKSRHGRLRAVDDVSFRVPKGRVLAVIGESGSGKSAMLRSIIGIQPTTANVGGEVLVEGRDLLRLSPKERARSRGRDEDLREDIAMRKAVDLIVDSAKPVPLAADAAGEDLWTPEKGRGEGASGKLWTPGS